MSVESLDKRFADLFDRLNTLQEATAQLKELIDRLANSNFEPGSVPIGAPEDDNVAAELSSEINQILREQEEELELLQEEIIDIHPGKSGSALHHDKDRLKDGASRLEEELRDCRKYFRKAQIAAKHNLREAQRREREILYASFSNPRSGASSPAPTTTATPTSVPTPTTVPFPRRRKQRTTEMSKEEQMISASHDVTQSMRRTHDMMAAELAKSDFAHNTLKESTEALAQLSENYSGLDTMLSNSRALLGTLLKSQKSDTWYLQSAFYLLAVTVSWLIFRRLLWGPTWWLVWLPLKLVFKTGLGISKAVGLRGSPVQSESASLESNLQQQQQEAYMNNKDVPTIKVNINNPPAESQAAAQEDLVMEHIAKVVDEMEEEMNEMEDSLDPEAEVVEEVNKDEETILREREPWELPNPKKRMMEGPSGEEYRMRDEL
ncbi:Sec20-domain-containing protein [Poronia punctata]|nr:Sec20-domain-containing protein [Poronia punctata]